MPKKEDKIQTRRMVEDNTDAEQRLSNPHKLNTAS